MIIVQKRNYSNTYNQYAYLEKNGCFLFTDDNDIDWSFDLENKQFFGNLRAIKKEQMDAELYGTSNDFDHVFMYRISIIKKLVVSKKEIEENHFHIKRDIEPLLDKAMLKEENPPEFELYYKLHGLKKVKISYNKKYLPTKTEGYFDDEGEKNGNL